LGEGHSRQFCDGYHYSIRLIDGVITKYPLGHSFTPNEYAYKFAEDYEKAMRRREELEGEKVRC